MKLHVTNGDSVAGALMESTIEGTVLPWRDVLHEGPVSENLTDEELQVVRARFIADQGWAEYDEALRDIQQCDHALSKCRDYDEVVLWFEHDLYDQLQLIQILDRLAQIGPGSTGVSLICVDRFPGVERFIGLGQLSPKELVSLFPSRVFVTEATYETASAAWQAFRATDPTVLRTILDLYDDSQLPFLFSAIVRLMEEYPGRIDGLSRTERTALEELADGPRPFELLFERVNACETAPFLGDTTFRSVLDRIHHVTSPLIDVSKDEITITETGRNVLAGKADMVVLNGVDRWLGGVHLTGRAVGRRWDLKRRELVNTSL